MKSKWAPHEERDKTQEVLKGLHVARPQAQASTSRDLTVADRLAVCPWLVNMACFCFVFSRRKEIPFITNSQMKRQKWNEPLVVERGL